MLARNRLGPQRAEELVGLALKSSEASLGRIQKRATAYTTEEAESLEDAPCIAPAVIVLNFLEQLP